MTQKLIRTQVPRKQKRTLALIRSLKEIRTTLHDLFYGLEKLKAEDVIVLEELPKSIQGNTVFNSTRDAELVKHVIDSSTSLRLRVFNVPLFIFHENGCDFEEDYVFYVGFIPPRINGTTQLKKDEQNIFTNGFMFSINSDGSLRQDCMPIHPALTSQ